MHNAFSSQCPLHILVCYALCIMISKAERLRQARQNAGFESAAEAARRHGWSVPTYSGHENGSRGFTADTAQDYARAFRVSPSWLLYGQEPGADWRAAMQCALSLCVRH